MDRRERLSSTRRWQEDVERRPVSARALAVDLSAVPRDHLVRDRESESGSVGLRREERLEDLMEHLRGNPVAGVGHGDVDERFGMRHDGEWERRSRAWPP